MNRYRYIYLCVMVLACCAATTVRAQSVFKHWEGVTGRPLLANPYGQMMQQVHEYEYTYYDGEFRFARIKAKSKRKAIGSVQMDDVLGFAPKGDRSVYKYENDDNVKVKDYTSGNNGTPYYDIILKDSAHNNYVLIKAELDSKYLDAVCFKNASKVIRRAGE